jgi:hypothetical protein
MENVIAEWLPRLEAEKEFKIIWEGWTPGRFEPIVDATSDWKARISLFDRTVTP